MKINLHNSPLSPFLLHTPLASDDCIFSMLLLEKKIGMICLILLSRMIVIWLTFCRANAMIRFNGKLARIMFI